MSTINNLSKLNKITTLTDLSRVLISMVDNSFISIGNMNTEDSSHNLAFTPDLTTYNDFFVKTFQLSASGGYYRIDSDLHSLYSIDYKYSNGENYLFFNNNWGQYANSNSGYLSFSYDSDNSYLIAQNRYALDASSYYHYLDPSFSLSGYYVNYNSRDGSLNLVNSSTSATQFYIYNSPFSLSIPSDFNPTGISYQPNGRVSIENYISNSIDDMYNKISNYMTDSTYLNQIATPGADVTTAIDASNVLTTIINTLSDVGENLRYDSTLYTNFRNGLLARTTQSDGIANGSLGQNIVPYVYYTNEQDPSGNYHPFMCIGSYSIIDKPARLLDVHRPPGDGTTGGYASQKVTRDATIQLYLFKMPMKDYGLVTNLTDNDLSTYTNTNNSTIYRNLRDHDGLTDSDISYSNYNYASISGLGVAIDGLVMYPVFNNTIVTSQSVAELTSTGFHVGQGMGLHYHADGHGAIDNSFNLYNNIDYVGNYHPPLIGIGFDGVALFGKYDASYANMHGYSTSLDSFGGHSHGNYGYHYHCHTVYTDGSMNEVNEYLPNSFTIASGGNNTNGDVSTYYTLHILMKGAWKGEINSIPRFWANDCSQNVTYNDGVNSGGNGSPSYALSQNHIYVGKSGFSDWY